MDVFLFSFLFFSRSRWETLYSVCRSESHNGSGDIRFQYDSIIILIVFVIQNHIIHKSADRGKNNIFAAASQLMLSHSPNRREYTTCQHLSLVIYLLKYSRSKAPNGFRINYILRLRSWERVRDARQFNARPVGFEINDETLHIPKTKLAAAAASNPPNDEQSKLENLHRTFQE